MEALQSMPALTAMRGLAQSIWFSARHTGVESGSVKNVSERTITLSEPPTVVVGTRHPRRLADPNLSCHNCEKSDDLVSVSLKTGLCIDCDLQFSFWIYERQEFLRQLASLGDVDPEKRILSRREKVLEKKPE